MGSDIDFVITVDGEDITKDVMSWTLHEVDDGTSSLTVKIANPNFIHSGAYGTGCELSIMFGSSGSLSESIKMETRTLQEDYSLGYPTVTLKAEDATRDMEEATTQGNMEKGMGPKAAMEELAKGLNLKMTVEGAREDEFKKNNYLTTLTGGTAAENIAWYQRMLKWDGKVQ